jgi:hypothetical protein
MKKLYRNHRRVFTAAIAVLACCTGSAHATVEQNKGTNAIAFSEQRGDKTANLVLSRLDLAMMDPVERDNMLASLETQYGKPKAWASRAGRSTSTSVFGFGRDGEKEKYGVRLRARQAMPSFSSELSQVVPAEKVPAALGKMASADLLRVERSEVLTWRANQDDYLGNGNAYSFRLDHQNRWLNPGFNYKLNFGDGLYFPIYNGVEFKIKTDADVAGRLGYRQWWYKPQVHTNFTNMLVDKGDWTRDVTGNAKVGGRASISFIVMWGHDWNLAWAGYWGLGAEISVAFGVWQNFHVNMVSTNTKSNVNTFTAGSRLQAYVEAQPGSVWIGNTEHKKRENDWSLFDRESHKLIHGAKAQIVFVGTAGAGHSYRCSEYDWYNDKWNNIMSHSARIGRASIDGKLSARAELRFGPVVFQEGYEIWSGSKEAAIWEKKIGEWNDHNLDLLL